MALVDQYENEVEPGTFAVIPRWCVHQSVNLGEEEPILLEMTTAVVVEERRNSCDHLNVGKRDRFCGRVDGANGEA